MSFIQKRVFAFSLVSLTWIILGIANNIVIKFRETHLTFSDLRMIQNALDLSKQYLSKSSIILIILLFIFFALFKILLNYGLDNDIISKNF